MRVFVLLFLFLLSSFSDIIGWRDKSNVVVGSSFVSQIEVKIKSQEILNGKKDEKNILTKSFEQVGENGYVTLGGMITSHEVVRIYCKFRIGDFAEKTKVKVLLIKELAENASKNGAQNSAQKPRQMSTQKSKHDEEVVHGCVLLPPVEDLHTTETLVFANVYENDYITSSLSILLINLVPVSGYYKFTIYITDGGNNYMQIPLFKIYLYFYNKLPIVKYPMKKRENIILKLSSMKRELTRPNMHWMDELLLHICRRLQSFRNYPLFSNIPTHFESSK
ncbi:hypothetical protein POVCU2_0025100 [Plasmodium ovale curtisi]|uniref:Dolichyl-diphosphooligosaccharide--protein glycosyltransferase subunit 1 n=1 Tax=Plasmodium ovale curtisi TaxID=864141 RepID=A0A1A8VZB8_PLAOA|nr:hypothetical protein POVCU2_0025100 [Plasmodium ovale curtisi]SBS92385.1 hypothetical protein POVCU1_022820 [Plasmodium ovale curtisi]